MDLSRLIYISEATRPIPPAELRALVDQSQVNNAAKGVTGLLLYTGRYFLQVLEGDELRVSGLYAHICEDARHTSVMRLQFKRTDRRLFPEWGMQLAGQDQARALDMDRMNKTLLNLRLTSGGDDATEAVALLQAFRDQLTRRAA